MAEWAVCDDPEWPDREQKLHYVRGMIGFQGEATGRTSLHWCCRCISLTSVALSQLLLNWNPGIVLVQTWDHAVVHADKRGETSGPGLLVC